MTVTESSGLHFAWLRQPHLEEDVVFTAASVLHDSGFLCFCFSVSPVPNSRSQIAVSD